MQAYNFSPQGPIASFSSASSAPTAVGLTPASGVQTTHVCITNVDGTNDATVGWGATDTEAKLNAVAGNSQRQFYIPHGQQVIIAAPGTALYTGIAVASTAVIKVQAGIME